MTDGRTSPGECVLLVPSAALLDEIGPAPGTAVLPLDEGASPDEVLDDVEVMLFGAEFRHLAPRLGEFPRLRLIQTLNAGVEMLLPHVPPGVTLCNASGVHDIPVAEWVVASLVAMRRGLPRFWSAQQRHVWDTDGNALTTPPDRIPFDDLEGARVLIVGYGSIGRRVEAMLVPFGAEITRVAFHPRDGVHGPDALDQLLPQADAVVLLAPLTDQTRGMLDARRLRLLPNGATVVNGARGALIDQAALERELRAHRLTAVLDVTDPEPLPSSSSLWDAPGLLITPHTAGSSKKWMARAYRFAGDQVRRYLAGEPLLNVRSLY